MAVFNCKTEQLNWAHPQQGPAPVVQTMDSAYPLDKLLSSGLTLTKLIERSSG